MRLNGGRLTRLSGDPSPVSTNVRSCQVTWLEPHRARMGCSKTRRIALAWRPAPNQMMRCTSRGPLKMRSAEECSLLRSENAELRSQIDSLISNAPEIRSKVSHLLEQHAALARLGQALGEHIPSFLDDENPVPLETQEDNGGLNFLDQEVLVEIEDDETLVFKFQNALAVSNNLISSSMSSSSDKWSFPSEGTKRASGSPNSSSAVVTQRKSEAELAIETSNKAVLEHNPADVVQGKEDWLFLTVPSELIAGGKAVLYLNKEQSNTLRHQPNVALHAKCNNWELDMDDGDRISMHPVGALVPGTNFYKAEVSIPADAYEMNFIFSNTEDLYDNNDSQNYSLHVDGEMTEKKWIDTAPERAEAEYLKKKELERIAAEKAEKERETAALEQDALDAQNLVDFIKQEYEELTRNARTSFKDDSGAQIILAEQKTVRGAEQIKIFYNRSATCLADADVERNPLMLRVGHNGWNDPLDVQLKLSKSKQSKQVSDPGEWWEAALKVPVDAIALNMVVFSGDTFDNNRQNDYSIIVDRGSDVMTWADSILQPLKKKLTEARRQREKEEKILEEKKLKERQAIRDKAEQVRRLQMRHVLFTKPEIPKAGKDVTIFYNPNNTDLNGSSDVSITLGYNRWRHPQSLGPKQMNKTAGDHYEVTMPVPKDAYALDFVFSNSEQHFDNRGGLDYNIPVEDAVVEEPPLYAVHIAVEMAPIAKVGGMGDVVTALGRAVQDLGHQVEVILPRYDFFLQSPLLGATRYETEFEWGGTRIFVTTCIVEGIRVWFIEPGNGMFSGGSVYQGNDDAGRFDFFSHAALEFLLRTQRQPDIIHCHDWSTATVARAYWQQYHEQGLWKPSVVFTIHNLNYGADLIGEAAFYSQRFTTVSPSYAWEIGGNPAVASNNAKLVGIRNGIDVDIWNPETDQFVPVNYSHKSCEEGKSAAREALRQRLGLTGWGDKPLVGVVTRLTKQKGTHLIAHSCWKTLERGGQFVLLGSAPDPKVQAEFDGLAQMHAGENAAFCFAFDEPLSHLIYAACDMILVPSMFEPCGLTQMIAMRYGAVPVVRSTGGLKDTVFDVDSDKARAAWEMEGSTDWEGDAIDATNGFSFEGTDEGALDYALNRAFDAYYNDRGWFRSLQQRVMSQDWSWNKPAIDYIQLYYAAMKK